MAPLGELNGKAVLDQEIVREIRKRRAEGESAAALAQRLGVSRGAIYGVIRGDNWKHVA